MKLLILTQYFPPEVGAPQNRLYELAVCFQKKGADITVLTAMPNYPQMEIHEKYKGLKYYYEEMNGLKVHRTSIYVSENRGIISRLRNYFSFVLSSYKVGKRIPENFDFLLCESPPLFLGYTAVRLARKKNAKLIFNVSDLWPESAEKIGIVKNKFFLWMAYKLEAWIYKNSFLITGQTQGIVKNISSRFPAKKTYWIPNGVDLNYYNPAFDFHEWRKEKGFSNEDFILLYAGIIGHAQGLEVILQSAKNLSQEEKIKFVFLGSGPKKEKLMTIKQEEKIQNVYFFNAVPKEKMPEVLNSIDASMIPLKRLELFKGAIPSKIFESLAMQKPILLGVEGEAKQLFIHEGKCGLSFEPENADDLTKKILELYNNRNLLKTLGENGRRYVSEKFSRDKIAEDFWIFISSL